jgi:hypothetical protein
VSESPGRRRLSLYLWKGSRLEALRTSTIHTKLPQFLTSNTQLWSTK